MAANLPFTEEDLRSAAGPASYGRGLGYLNLVEDLEVSGTWATATVFGSGTYGVLLRFGDGGSGVAGLRGTCTCPFGAEGNFCKHCVATGLVALKSGDLQPERTPSAPGPGRGADPGPDPGPDPEEHPLISWLKSLTKDELLYEVLELIVEDPDVASRLEVRAAAKRTDVDGVRRAVRDLVWIVDYVEYREAGEYARDICRAADAIDRLTDAGAAAEAIEVAREAIEWLRHSFEMVDDSSGGVASAAFELLDVHLAACEAAPPDPVELADYLADLCLSDRYGILPSLGEYSELLGGAGTAALHERVAAAHEANPDDIHVRHVMESVVEAQGDVDALVALYATRLDEHGSAHLRIASKLDEAGRSDEALDWAERGAVAGPRPDDRLVKYLAGRYSAAGRTDDVLGLRRMLFAADRSLANFRALREAAIDSGAWQAEREPAIGLLRSDAPAFRPTPWFPTAGPVLVDALIDDGDLSAAWTAAQGIASESQLVRLANASVTERPADALAVYVKAIERLTQHTGDAIYQQIATHLLAARACHEALGTMDKFRQYMMLLRMGQKRKRNLMALLDQKGL